MRTLCLLLILANALFFGWAQLIDVNRSGLDRPGTPAAAPPPRIVLAQEVAGTPAARAPAQSPAPIEPPRVEPLQPADADQPMATAGSSQSAASGSCISVGPFPDLADGAQAQAALRAAGLEPRQRIEQGEVWVGYWVSIRGLATREEAEAVLRRLSENGITDAYILPGTETEHVLSLGVFSDYQRAQRRVEQVRSLGLEPQIVDRKRPGSVYWIDVDLSDPAQPLDMSMLQAEPGKIMRLELRACPGEARG